MSDEKMRYDAEEGELKFTTEGNSNAVFSIADYSPKIYDCPVHGEIESIVWISIPREGFPDNRQYCNLCWEDALIAAGVQRVEKKP